MLLLQIAFGTATGGLEVWETKNMNGSISLYKVDSKCEHLDVVSGVELFRSDAVPTKIITGSHDATLKVWELENGLVNLHTYHNAHSDAIANISSHPEEDLFVSASRAEALIWDHRQTCKPAIGLLEDYKYSLTATEWKSNGDCPDKIYLGDRNGHVLKLDRRAPGKIEDTIEVSPGRSIREIERSDGKLIVCGNSRQLVVYNDAHEIVQEYTSSTDWVRDFIRVHNKLHLLPGHGKVVTLIWDE